MASYISRALLAGLFAKSIAGYALATNLSTFTGEPDGACSGISNNCSAAGFRVDYYENPIGGNSPANTKPWNYYITEALRPLDSALTLSTVFEQNSGPPKLHHKKVNGNTYYSGWTRITSGNITVDANNFTLVYSGFYRAPETGTYTFCMMADNQNHLFFGHGNAFDCSNGNVNNSVNPLLTALDPGGETNSSCLDVIMNKDAYYPVRSVMKN